MFPEEFSKKNVSARTAVENTEADLYMLRDVGHCVESKDLDSNLSTLKRPFPYITELSSSQGIGALDDHRILYENLGVNA